MRILVAIAYYGTTNEPYVRELIESYGSMMHDVDVVLLTEREKDLHGCEQRIGLPTDNPYSLPFAYKALFEERQHDYDLFIYSEDDTLITEAAIDSFLWADSMLPNDQVPGFLRTEQSLDGGRRCSSVHGRFHWDPRSVVVVQGEVFAEFTNEHAAAFMLTREQLAFAIGSPAWGLPPRETLRHDMRVMAAVDPYLNCGLRKLICVSQLEQFLLPHLTNRYVESTYGVPLSELIAQTTALSNGEISNQQLVVSEANVDDPRWDVNYWRPPDAAAAEAIPTTARAVLSVGVGAATTEALLIERGHEVVGIPLDDVMAVTAGRRGLTTTRPSVDAALETLEGSRFDALLALGVLHHFERPTDVVSRLSHLLAPGAVVVASLPNVRRDLARAAVRRAPRPPLRRTFDEIDVHLTSPRVAGRWFKESDLDDVRITYPGAGRALARPVLARDFLVSGVVPRSPHAGRRT